LCKFIKEFNMLKTMTGLLSALPALAHEGHGLKDPHSHITDLVGLCIALVVIAVFYWAGRK
jgi:hypothetical protein